MSGRLFRAKDLGAPAEAWLTEDPGLPSTYNKNEAAIIDSESMWGKWLIEEQELCAVEIEWLPEDQQLRHIGAAQLPLNLGAES